MLICYWYYRIENGRDLFIIIIITINVFVLFFFIDHGEKLILIIWCMSSILYCFQYRFERLHLVSLTLHLRSAGFTVFLIGWKLWFAFCFVMTSSKMFKVHELFCFFFSFECYIFSSLKFFQFICWQSRIFEHHHQTLVTLILLI